MDLGLEAGYTGMGSTAAVETQVMAEMASLRSEKTMIAAEVVHLSYIPEMEEGLQGLDLDLAHFSEDHSLPHCYIAGDFAKMIPG